MNASTDAVEGRWLVVLGPDAVVMGVAGGAPPSWTGLAVDEIQELPPRLREAAHGIVSHVHHAPLGVGTPSTHHVPELPGAPIIELVAVEAVPMRRVMVQPKELLASSMEVLSRQAAGLDVELKIDTDGAIPRTSVDPEKIAWAVSTLVGNAFRYVRRGSRLMPGGSIRVNLSYSPSKGELSIVVQDDGPGIPAEKLPWLFRRAEGTTHAAGLGLMMVHDVIAAHGGTIDVRSETSGFDRGTTITLRIPAGSSQSVPPARSSM